MSSGSTRDQKKSRHLIQICCAERRQNAIQVTLDYMFSMISRKLPARFVCIRCWSRVLSQAEHFRSQPLLHPSGCRGYGLEAIARSFLEENPQKSPDQERESPEEDRETDGPSRDRELRSRQARNGDKSPLVRRTSTRDGGSHHADKKLRAGALAELGLHEPKRMYKSRGHRLEVDQAKLSVDMLGKPVEAIVLRERGKWKATERYWWAKQQREGGEEEDDASRVNMKNMLAKETSYASDSEAIRNIHELKPKETVLSRTQFEKLKDTLVNGFNNDQLREYEQMVSEKAALRSRKKKLADFVLNEPLWAPLVQGGGGNGFMAPGIGDSPEHDYIPPYGVGYMENIRSRKERLAMTVLRRCWGVSRQDLNEGPGRVDVKLDEVRFSMLLLGTQRFLAEKTRHFLKPGEHVELTRSEHKLSIIAPRSTAEVVLDEIIKLLRDTKTVVIPIDKICPETAKGKIAKKDLDAVGQVTNTLTRVDIRRSNVLVSWLDRRKSTGQWESSSDIVYRLLLLRYGGPKQPWAQLAGYPSAEVKPILWPESSSKDGQYAPVPVIKDSLSWADRSKTWARFVMPLSETATSADYPHLHNLLPFQVELGRTLDHQNSPVTERDWSARTSVYTKAVFGHVLMDTSDLSLAKQRKQVYRPHLESILLPVVPPFASLDLPLADQQIIDHWNTTILIRFQPEGLQPKLPSIAGCTLPSLELRLLAQRGKDAAVQRILSLRAVTSFSKRHVCLPNGPVDLSVEQTTYFELDGAGINGPAHPAAPVVDFLRKSDLRYADGKMYTPALLPRMRLPRRLLDSRDKTDDLFEVNYRFAGLETQDAVAADWKGFSLVHTTVNASPYGPRRGEVSLDAGPPSAWSNTAAAKPQPQREYSVTESNAAKDAFVDALRKLLSSSAQFRWTGDKSH